MSQIDFIVAMAIMIGVISFSVYYASADISTQFDQTNILELKQAAVNVENRLLQREDIKIMRARFEDTSSTDHSETIDIDFTGSISDIIMKDDSGNVVASGDDQISFSIYLPADSVKYYDIFYSGSAINIDVSGDTGISSRFLHEQDYQIVSDDCTADYDLMREEIGHNFRIKFGTCVIGPEPPEGTIIARSVPVIMRPDLKSEIANILVW